MTYPKECPVFEATKKATGCCVVISGHYEGTLHPMDNMPAVVCPCVKKYPGTNPRWIDGDFRPLTPAAREMLKLAKGAA